MKGITNEIILRVPMFEASIKWTCLALLGRTSTRRPGTGDDDRRWKKPFPGSAEYWERRYSLGGNSGVGSQGRFAKFKAGVLNEFVATRHVQSVIEFGCGDGRQLSLAKYPTYPGLDVSHTAIWRCKKLIKSDTRKSLRAMGEYQGEKADLLLLVTCANMQLHDRCSAALHPSAKLGVP